jgi:hypothetical protein
MPYEQRLDVAHSYSQEMRHGRCSLMLVSKSSPEARRVCDDMGMGRNRSGWTDGIGGADVDGCGAGVAIGFGTRPLDALLTRRRLLAAGGRPPSRRPWASCAGLPRFSARSRSRLICGAQATWLWSASGSS